MQKTKCATFEIAVSYVCTIHFFNHCLMLSLMEMLFSTSENEKHNGYVVVNREMSRNPESVEFKKKKKQEEIAMHNNLTNLFIFFLVFLLSPVISKSIFMFTGLELNPSSKSQ